MKNVILEINSKQFKVSEGDTIKLDSFKRGTPRVLFYQDDKKVLIGNPTVDNVKVDLELIEEKLDKKISVRRFRAKSRYRRNKGHRQPISIYKVKSIKENGS